ncbi:hypothetical protein LJY25_14540 [Hymenobacter sp. BT175]|uniref:hypothetical protein n=1 Tax=Hymenobacter translucens TaxID=2886507 RepID=UPI001D0DE744|nr:hypothetical protein [Hymenobacter translucens]MCC2547670.1 hypothetical protein [Hymenobacter translucens]
MITDYLRRYSALLAASLLGGCAVYTPMQPTIATIRTPGQAEVAASVQVSGRAELTAVYCPGGNLLLTGGATYLPKNNDTVFYTTRQWELGGGGYVPLGKNWQLTALGGYGAGYGNRGLVSYHQQTRGFAQFEARFSKLFGQAGLAYIGKWGSFGAVYRLSKVQFSQLDYRSRTTTALPMSTMLRHEPMLFGRVGFNEAQRWQIQGTIGFSGVDHPGRTDWTAFPTGIDARRALDDIMLLSLGVVFRPQLHKQ